MEKLYFLSQDYQEMADIACETYHLVLANYKNRNLTRLEVKNLFMREDIQREIALRMVDDYIYSRSTHPIVQEMAEDAGIKDWTDEDEEIYNYNCELIYIAMRAYLSKYIFNYTASC